MSDFISTVALSHQKAGELINTGDKVIDATVGNGFDTLFLAETVGVEGHVFGFDIQKRAINIAQTHLRKTGMLDHVTLIHAGHETMLKHIPEKYRKQIKAVFFNLGYLPGAVKSIITKPKTTILALDMAWRLIAIDGFISITYYPGHPGGADEAASVNSWVKNNEMKHHPTIHCEHRGHSIDSPGLFVIGKSPLNSSLTQS